MFKGIFSSLSRFGFNLKRSAMLNKYSSSESRYAAYDYFKEKAEKMLKEGKTEKLAEIVNIFLERLAIAVQNSIKDAEEKEYVKDLLQSLGEVVVVITKEFIINNYVIAHPIDILVNTVGKDETLNFLETVLTVEDTVFNDPLVEKRIEILKHFAGETNSSVLTKAKVFLNDSDDRLVIAAIRFIRDYVFAEDEDSDKVREEMVNRFLDEDTSMRIRIELLHVFVEQKWKVAGFKKRFEELLPEGYFINAQGYVRAIKQSIGSSD